MEELDEINLSDKITSVSQTEKELRLSRMKKQASKVSLSLLFVFFLHPELARALQELLLVVDLMLCSVDFVVQRMTLILEILPSALLERVLGGTLEETIEPANCQVDDLVVAVAGVELVLHNANADLHNRKAGLQVHKVIDQSRRLAHESVDGCHFCSCR